MDHQNRKPVIKSMYIDLYKQEFNIGQLLLLSWDVFSNNFSILVLTGLILYLPVFIRGELFIGSEPDIVQAILLIISGIIPLVVSLLISLSYYRIIESHLGDSVITISEALGYSLQRLGKATWSAVIGGIIVVLLSFLLVIPGIIWAVYYRFFVFVVAEKNIGGMNALAVSKSLVVGRWWKVLGYGLLITILVTMVAIIMEEPISMFTEGLTNRMFSYILIIILSAYATTAHILFYINLQHNRKQVDSPPPPKTTF